MLVYLKAKLRTRWTQFKNKKQRRDPTYEIFHGSHENYLRNGAWVLEEGVAIFHGKANPFRHFSVTDLNSMNIKTIPLHENQEYWWHKGFWEGIPVLVKVSKTLTSSDKCFLLREIVVASQMATHNNVHKLLGCCLETEWPVLVYEWIEIETLEDSINKNKRVVKWKDRLRIAWEISHAISYLHNAFPRSIVHRYLDPERVFLDDDGSVRLCDLSLCIPIPRGEEFVRTLDAVGRMAYMAPEYLLHGEIAESIDVYSYGALLLTLVAWKIPGFESGEQGQIVPLLTRVQKENSIINVVDSKLILNGISDIEDLQLRASIHLALQCLVEEKDHRPSMREVATQLKNMLTYPELILNSRGFEEGSFFRIFYGSTENYIRNKNMVIQIQESMSLLYGNIKPVHLFSVDDLNSMTVHFSVFYYHTQFKWYQGSWEGKYILLQLPNAHVQGSRSSDEICLLYVREIVAATQIATHDNVHKLIGCCLETATPVLVYEWMPSESLRNRMHSKILPLLKWKDRIRNAWEISHVISYLHSAFPPPIVHRFLYLINIFLDQINTVKISNFSHSLSIREGEKFQNIYRLDSYEDYQQKNVEKWTDVYSFGILIFLEFLTGQLILTDLIDRIDEEIRKNAISLIVEPR